MSRTTKITLALFALILLVFPLKTNPYIIQVAMTWITYGILGMAFAFSMRAGLPRIDVMLWWSIGGFTTALLMTHGWNFFLAALIAGTISMVLGLMIFSVLIPRGVTIFFMLCLVFFFAAPNLMQFLGKVPFLHRGHTDITAATLGPLQFVFKRDLYYLGVFLLGLNVTVFYLLYHSRTGRAWNAISSSLKLAKSVGVDVIKYRVSNMVIGNFFISLVGSYSVAYIGSSPPLMFSVQAGGMVMMLGFIGGLSHSFAGPLLGAFLLTFLPEYFRMASIYEPIITAAITIMVIIFMPTGILGWADLRIKPWLQRYKWNGQRLKVGNKEENETAE